MQSAGAGLVIVGTNYIEFSLISFSRCLVEGADQKQVNFN